MITMATSVADATAVEAIQGHHAQLAGALSAGVDRVTRAASGTDAEAAELARATLVKWCRDELLPHAPAEEAAMYPPAQKMPDARLLLTGMLDEHRALTELVTAIEQATDPVRTAALATALQTLFNSHVAKRNELLLPLLAGSREVSVATLLEDMRELLGDHHQPGDSHEHACNCGEVEPGGPPELDARDIPHAIRHATIFGALGTVAPGSGLVLVAPHDPQPLLAQVEQRWPNVFEVSYLDRGTDAWRLLFLHRGPGASVEGVSTA